MNRWLLMIICFVVMAGCKKSADEVTSSTVINAQAAIDDQKIADYIKTNNLQAVHVGSPKVDTIGVWYVIEDAGTIPVLYTSSTSVTVGFTAKTLGGSVFTNNAGINGVYPTYVLGQTIKGWQLGIQSSKINKGGKIRILMASRYAYGPYPQSQYSLAANSVLDFEINMFDVIN